MDVICLFGVAFAAYTFILSDARAWTVGTRQTGTSHPKLFASLFQLPDPEKKDSRREQRRRGPNISHLIIIHDDGALEKNLFEWQFAKAK